jgi:hypothetical protein
MSIIGLIWYREKSKSSKADKIITLGSLLTAMLIILRAGPLRILYLFNLLIPLLPFIKNFRMKFNGFNATKVADEMTEEEAREILGVSANASEEEIQAAYKKLILKNHPDHGGSKYIAAKLNKAKDKLLKKR